MNPHISAIVLGVGDLARARQFYAEGLGMPLQVDTKAFIKFTMTAGSSDFGLYPWDALAADAGVPPEGSGFRGVTLSYIVRSDDRVDAVLADAERAGGTIVKPAARAQWGGYTGHFADPDGNLWKVASATGEDHYGE
jgi:catechol 2,3-dioxygenase-like lactoylglutathione lyase family enzyme